MEVITIDGTKQNQPIIDQELIVEEDSETENEYANNTEFIGKFSLLKNSLFEEEDLNSKEEERLVQNNTSLNEESVPYPSDWSEEILELVKVKDDQIQRLKSELQDLEQLGTQAVDQLSIQINEKDIEIEELRNKIIGLTDENNLLRQSRPSDSEGDIYKARSMELDNLIKQLQKSNSQLQEANASLLKKNKKMEEILTSKKIFVEFNNNDYNNATSENNSNKGNSNNNEEPQTESMTIEQLKQWVHMMRKENKNITQTLEIYLVEKDFQENFGMKRQEFKGMPNWVKQIHH